MSREEWALLRFAILYGPVVLFLAIVLLGALKGLFDRKR